MDMGNISSRSDEILIFSLALRARENIKFHHYSMRYIPYPFKTNRYPLCMTDGETKGCVRSAEKHARPEDR